MRRLLCLCFAILLVVSLGVAYAATPGSQLDHGAGDVLGQKKFPSDPHKIFRLVRYIGDSTLAADSLVIWHLTEDDGVTIGTTTTSNDSAVASIIVQPALARVTAGNTAAQDVGQRNWTWLQTYGKSQVDIYEDVSAGDAMGTAQIVQEAGSFVASTSSSGLNGNAGFFYDAGSAEDTDVECFLRLD